MWGNVKSTGVQSVQWFETVIKRRGMTVSAKVKLSLGALIATQFTDVKNFAPTMRSHEFPSAWIATARLKKN